MALLCGWECEKIAIAKGHNGALYYGFGFIFTILGFLPVIALKDLKAQEERKSIIKLLHVNNELISNSMKKRT